MIRSCKRGSLSDGLAAMIGPSATVRPLNLLVSDQYSVKKRSDYQMRRQQSMSTRYVLRVRGPLDGIGIIVCIGLLVCFFLLFLSSIC